VDGVFVAIGRQPATSPFNGALDLDESGYILTKIGSSHTSASGVFAAGDVCNSAYRQAITAAAQGCMAAIDADKFLSKGEK
jgi:thioredoxin reductase (NADPH)